MEERIRHLKWLLVDQIVDLTTATVAIRDHMEVMRGDNPPPPYWSICYFRMCSTFLIVSLSKLWETLDHFSAEIRHFPIEVREACGVVRKELERRKVYQFRSKYAAHVIDKATKKPLSLVEGERRYKEIIGGEDVGDFAAFCDWINPEANPMPETSVMHAVVCTRDHCLELVGGDAQRP
jgi:hypothetical protein